LVEDVRISLANPDEETRREAVLSLAGKSGASSLSLLGEALGDESWRVRKAAVTAYQSYPVKGAAARSLIGALADPENAGLRSGAMETLVRMGSEASPYLLESIGSPDSDVRKFIVDILGEIGGAEAVDAILPLTRDPVEVIRLAAVEALGSIGGARAFDALLGLLSITDVSLQFSLLHALGRLGKPIPLDSIRPLFDKKILRRALFDALGQTRSPESIEFIVEGLGDSARSSRQAAVRALHQIASDPAVVGLVKQTVRKNLAGQDLAPFIEFLETNHLATKRATVTLLSLLGSPEATSALVRAASDDSIQAEVAEVLSRLGAAAPDAINEMVRKEAPRLRDDVARALIPRPEQERPIGPMKEGQFQRVRDLVAEEAGLYYDRELKYLVERRVQRRMEELGLVDYGDYLDLIGKESGGGVAERRVLIGVLSTNETYFFREDFQLRAFKEEIIPAMAAAKNEDGGKNIRVWSAGCSSGEEPYTIAILVRETPELAGFNVEIIASDISDRMVDKARAALYSESSFRATDPGYLAKYFEKEGQRYRLIDDIKNMVEFNNINLLRCADEPALADLDLIFCRNVIIYFSQDAKLKVVDQFHKLLRPGGYLLLGHSESLMNVSTSFALVHLKNDLVYRKPEARP